MRSLIVVAALLVVTSAARADNKTAAEAEFVSGKQLLKEGKVADACDAFAKSQELDPQNGTSYNLGLCYQQLGKLASAWAIFRDLAQVDTNAARKKDSGKRADDLYPKLNKLLVTTVGPAVRGMAVMRDGADVTSVLGVEDPIDPGTYHVTASAPGYQAWSTDVTVSGEGGVVTVKIPALEPEGSTTTHEPPPPPPTKPPPLDVGMVHHEHASPGKGRKLLGIGLAGAGLVATGVGFYFGSVASSDLGKAKDLCGNDLMCPNQASLTKAQGYIKDTRSAGNLSTALVAGGLAVAAGGVILWLTAPHASHSEEAHVQLVPQVAPDRVGLAAMGAF